MKGRLRQSMAWLHTWSGVVFGWLLFAIFVTGTIAYFRHEVTFWMQPELHASRPAPNSAELALNRLETLAPNAESWMVSLPSERASTLTIAWRPQGAPPGRRGWERADLDASTGELLHPRETAGGNFLYRFHFELYGMPRSVARWIVGIATMFMLVAIISGVITHKKIFKDFFTFRPNKGQRSWLDLHNVTAVLALPYHLMITYSGLLLFMGLLMPFALDGDSRRHGAAPGQQPQVAATAAQEFRPLPPIAPLLRQARESWGMGVGRISVDHPGTTRAVIELAPLRNARLGTSNGGAAGAGRLRFDALSGERLPSAAGAAISTARAVDNAFGSLHRARFADISMRWLFFLSGVAGTLMVGTGLLLWVAKRAPRHAKRGVKPFGFRMVERLNVGATVGLFVAVAGYFWLNRLLPVELADRALWEIRGFFLVWSLCLVQAVVWPAARAWRMQLWGAAALLLGLPVLNALTTETHLGWSLSHGRWLLAGFELTVIAIGASCGYAAWHLATRHKRAVAGGKTTPVDHRRPAGAVEAP